MLSDAGKLFPAFEQNNVPVILASNNRYAPYAGVFIQSLLDHASEENNYDIIIFQRDISEENKRLLKGLAAGRANISIRFYDPSPFLASFHYAEENHLFPLEVYYRIIAPYIMDYPGRMITVDVDTLLKTDIARLMDEELAECSVGGVCDVVIIGMCLCDHTSFRKNIKMRDYYEYIYGLDYLRNYINGGLLLFDRNKYVQELKLETIFRTAQQGEYAYEEQDILNILMKGKMKVLDFAWNVRVRSNAYNTRFIDAGWKLYDGACERAYENPYLLHWAGKPTPWVCPDVPWGNEWWQTALRTPFVGHIFARMIDELEKRRAYFKKRYGKEMDVWEPTPEVEKKESHEV